MSTFNTLLIKTATTDKSVTFLSGVVVASKIIKQAKLESIKQSFRTAAMDKQADEKPFMDRMSAWWGDDANKAGVAGAGIAGLLGYGLMPGKNKIMKLLGALGLGTAGYFGGQALWPTIRGWFGAQTTDTNSLLEAYKANAIQTVKAYQKKKKLQKKQLNKATTQKPVTGSETTAEPPVETPTN